MKRLLLILITVICAQVSFGQGEGKNAPGSEGVPSCPPFYCPYAQYVFTTFNFHKPKTDCTSGFGLCIRGVYSSGCRPCSSWKNSGGYTKLENDKVTCSGEVKDGKLELRIPAELKKNKDFIKEDFSLFTIEKGTLSVYINGKEKLSKAGTYKVVAEVNEYVVLIDLE